MIVQACEWTPKVRKVLCVVCRSLIAYGLKAVQLLAVRLYFLLHIFCYTKMGRTSTYQPCNFQKMLSESLGSKLY